MSRNKSLVKDYMTKNVISVSPDTKTDEIIKNINIMFDW